MSTKPTSGLTNTYDSANLPEHIRQSLRPVDAETCSQCDGSGTYDGSLVIGAPPCPRCAGKGWIIPEDE